MPHSVLLMTAGGADQLRWQETQMPAPQAGEVLIRQKAVGLNFIDIYHRSGFYPLPSYPAVIGMEGAGIVEAVGQGVTTFAKGQRVAYGAGPIGAYAEYRTIATEKLVALPDAVSFEQAAAIMLKGLTVQALVRGVFPVKQGDTILVHAAAGGIGLLLCQWAKHLGAHVIGTVSSEEKAVLAKQAGCDEIIFYRREDVAARARELTAGRGVQVVYDAVGKDTYQASLDSLAKRGMFVSFGQASGPMPAIESQELARRGSLYFTRPSVMHYVENPADYVAAAQELFALMGQGKLTVHTGQRFALADAARAHEALESGRTQGSTVLLVE